MELKKAGHPDYDILHAGYTAMELKEAGYSAIRLKKAGYSVMELKKAGYPDYDILHAGYSVMELKEAGYSAIRLKEAGYSVMELKEAGYSVMELKEAGHSLEALREAGYPDYDILHAGYSVMELKEAGYSAIRLKEAGYSAMELKKAGHSDDDILCAGYPPFMLKEAGYPTEVIKESYCFENENAFFEKLISTSNDRFEGFVHETTIDNLMSMIEDGYLYSREYLMEHDKEFDSIANEGVLDLTSYNVKSHVRFYFRPRTPTYYHFEKKCRNNVVCLIFDKDLAIMENASISIGNACNDDRYHFNEYVTSEFNENFWRKVFDFSGAYRINDDFYDDGSNGYWTVSNKNERHTELLVPNKVSLNYLKKIIFKDKGRLSAFRRTEQYATIKELDVEVGCDPHYFF